MHGCSGLSVNAFSSFNDNVVVHGSDSCVQMVAELRGIRFEADGYIDKPNVNVAASPQQAIGTPKKEGCYIATAVYGSYEAPEVLILREYRDSVLYKSFLGRLFIKIYDKYTYKAICFDHNSGEFGFFKIVEGQEKM